MSNVQWVSIKERQPAPGSRVLATDGTIVCEASVHTERGRYGIDVDPEIITNIRGEHMMDYDKLVAAIALCGSTPKVYQCQKCAYWSGGDMSKCIPKMTKDAVTAIENLRAELARVEAERDTLIKRTTGECWTCIRRYECNSRRGPHKQCWEFDPWILKDD